MKFSFFSLPVLMSGVAEARVQTVSVSTMLFVGSPHSVVKALEEELTEEIARACGSQERLVGQGSLRSYPRATATAQVTCQ